MISISHNKIENEHICFRTSILAGENKKSSLEKLFNHWYNKIFQLISKVQPPNALLSLWKMTVFNLPDNL